MVPPTPPPWVALFSSPTGGIASQFKSITYRCDGPEESIILSRGNFFAVRSYIQSGGWFYSRKLDSSWGALDSRFSKRSGFLQIHKSAPILTGIIEKNEPYELDSSFLPASQTTSLARFFNGYLSSPKVLGFSFHMPFSHVLPADSLSSPAHLPYMTPVSSR